MSNLTRSFVRGFGASLGVMAAKKTVDMLTPDTTQVQRQPVIINDSSPKEVSIQRKLSGIQKFFVFIFWIGGCILLFNLISNPIPGLIFFAIGWTIPAMLMKGKFSQEDLELLERTKELKEQYIQEINSLITDIEEFPVNTGLSLVKRVEGGRAETITKRVDDSFNVQWLHKILTSKKRIMGVLNDFKERYDIETIEKITSSQPWLGMTERQLLDMRNYDANYFNDYIGNLKTDNPDNIEIDVLKSGKEKRTLVWGNKYSGDVFKFEDGVLVSFKDR